MTGWLLYRSIVAECQASSEALGRKERPEKGENCPVHATTWYVGVLFYRQRKNYAMQWREYCKNNNSTPWENNIGNHQTSADIQCHWWTDKTSYSNLKAQRQNDWMT